MDGHDQGTLCQVQRRLRGRSLLAGQKRQRERLQTLPLSLRLIREIHARLMEGVRGEHQTPGEFRHSQNWIGPAGGTLNDAPFVPPPVPEMHEGLLTTFLLCVWNLLVVQTPT